MTIITLIRLYKIKDHNLFKMEDFKLTKDETNEETERQLKFNLERFYIEKRYIDEKQQKFYSLTTKAKIELVSQFKILKQFKDKLYD